MEEETAGYKESDKEGGKEKKAEWSEGRTDGHTMLSR